MIKNLQFILTTDTLLLAPLKDAWRKEFTAPQDGMWEAFIDMAQDWVIRAEELVIGHACVDGENRLLQFYLFPEWMFAGAEILQEFVRQQGIREAIVGTNNPYFLSTAMLLNKSARSHTLLFSYRVPLSAPETLTGTFRPATPQDLQSLVEFVISVWVGQKPGCRAM